MNPEIEAIVNVLMNADAVRCDIESYEPDYYASNALYHIPAGRCVQVNYNTLAKAIYDAGYRKGEGNNGRTGHEN